MARPRTVATDRPAAKITVWLPGELVDEIKTEAQTRGVPVSEIARRRIVDCAPTPIDTGI